MNLKVLSVREPWASLMFIGAGAKDVENRTWSTKHRGRLLIHASSTLILKDYNHSMKGVMGMALQKSVLGLHFEDIGPLMDSSSVRGHLGRIIGEVSLDAVMTGYGGPWAFDDCYHWHLSQPRKYDTPTPFKSGLGLRNIDSNIVNGA